MPLVNCEINLILTWSSTCIIINSAGARIFAITDTKPYVTVVTLVTQDSAKLSQELKSGFKTTINCNKFQSKVIVEIQNPYSYYLVDHSFQGVNRLFVLPFEDKTH